MPTYTSHQEDADFQAGIDLGLNHNKLGMWLFLGSEVMFFGALVANFIRNRAASPSLAEQALLDVNIVGLNTFLLLTSSLTVVLGLAAAKSGDKGSLTRNLIFTTILGSAFLAGQIFEFSQLYAEGMTLTSSLYASSFYTLTGFHGLHVFAGILWALLVLGRAARGRYTPESHDGYEGFGLYWHFVDVVWIFLFTIIYLI